MSVDAHSNAVIFNPCCHDSHESSTLFFTYASAIARIRIFFLFNFNFKIKSICWCHLHFPTICRRLDMCRCGLRRRWRRWRTTNNMCVHWIVNHLSVICNFTQPRACTVAALYEHFFFFNSVSFVCSYFLFNVPAPGTHHAYSIQHTRQTCCGQNHTVNF